MLQSSCAVTRWPRAMVYPGPVPGDGFRCGIQASWWGTETRAGLWPATRWWVAEGQQSQAEMMNYTVVEASGVLATHITGVVKTQCGDLVTRDEVAALAQAAQREGSALVEEVIPTQIKPGELQKVLHNLLRERVPIRDLETILETLGEWASKTKDLEVLTEAVRHGLSRTICNQYRDEQNTIHCVTSIRSLKHDQRLCRTQRDAAAFCSCRRRWAGKSPKTSRRLSRRSCSRASTVWCFALPQVRSHVRRLIERIAACRGGALVQRNFTRHQC